MVVYVKQILRNILQNVRQIDILGALLYLLCASDYSTKNIHYKSTRLWMTHCNLLQIFTYKINEHEQRGNCYI